MKTAPIIVNISDKHSEACLIIVRYGIFHVYYLLLISDPVASYLARTN
jgi:hypothetical protein